MSADDAAAIVRQVVKLLNEPDTLAELGTVEGTNDLARRIAYTAVTQVEYSDIWHRPSERPGVLDSDGDRTTLRQIEQLADQVLQVGRGG